MGLDLREKKGKKSSGFSGESMLCNALEGARMEFRGNREAVLEDCRGILEYDTDVVRVRTGKHIVRFTGRNLEIHCMTSDSLVITGFISGVEFMRQERR